SSDRGQAGERSEFAPNRGPDAGKAALPCELHLPDGVMRRQDCPAEEPPAFSACKPPLSSVCTYPGFGSETIEIVTCSDASNGTPRWEPSSVPCKRWCEARDLSYPVDASSCLSRTKAACEAGLTDQLALDSTVGGIVRRLSPSPLESLL